MCGRYVLTSPAEALRRLFEFVEQPNLAPRWNIAPTQEVPVIRQRRKPEGERTLQLLRWGLVPSWAESLAGGAKMINARADTLRQKRAFRQAFERRRCLVPADGFYEWKPDDPTRQPYLVARPDRAPFAFAGLWERWSPPVPADVSPPEAGSARAYVDSFTIITTDANPTLGALHPRMPVILAEADYARWLDPDAGLAALEALQRPAPDALLQFAPADRRVNNVRNDDAELLRRAEPAAE
jgi:putative SOS response-associated peptidase YedK